MSQDTQTNNECIVCYKIKSKKKDLENANWEYGVGITDYDWAVSLTRTNRIVFPTYNWKLVKINNKKEIIDVIVDGI